jgi:hypothetical protein
LINIFNNKITYILYENNYDKEEENITKQKASLNLSQRKIEWL